MSNNNKNTSNSKNTWKTKYGPRRVREELPTLEEAIAAAQGLTDELEEQVYVAASLMGMPEDEVRTALLKTAPPRKDVVTTLAFTGPASAPRTVVVERKPSRRIATGAGVGASVERVTLRPRSASAARQSW